MPKSAWERFATRRLTNREKKRMDETRAKHYLTRQENKEKTQQLMQCVRDAYARQCVMQEELDKIKVVYNAKLDEIGSGRDAINVIIAELAVLNPGGCDKCGLLGGHEPLQCMECVDIEAEPCCEDCGFYSHALRWDKEPTEEYVKRVVDILKQSYWNQLSESSEESSDEEEEKESDSE